MVLALPVKPALETYFGKSFMCLSGRSLEILPLRATWREMLNVPSVTVLSETLKTLRLESFRFFVPCKNYCVNLFSHVMLTTVLIHCRYKSVCG